MRVMEIVRLVADRYDEGSEGKVVAVGGKKNPRVTVKWDDGKMTEHGREDLKLVFSPFTREQV